MSKLKESIIGLLSPGGKQDLKRWRQQEKTKQEALTTAFSQSTSNGGIEIACKESAEGDNDAGGN